METVLTFVELAHNPVRESESACRRTPVIPWHRADADYGGSQESVWRGAGPGLLGEHAPSRAATLPRPEKQEVTQSEWLLTRGSCTGSLQYGGRDAGVWSIPCREGTLGPESDPEEFWWLPKTNRELWNVNRRVTEKKWHSRKDPPTVALGGKDPPTVATGSSTTSTDR